MEHNTLPTVLAMVGIVAVISLVFYAADFTGAATSIFSYRTHSVNGMCTRQCADSTHVRVECTSGGMVIKQKLVACKNSCDASKHWCA